MNLPTPKTALGRAVERAVLLFVAALIGAVVDNVTLSPLFYFALKTVLDVLNKNIPSL